MALGQIDYLVSNNLASYPVSYQRQIGGNRSVDTAADLKNIPLGILIDPTQDIKFSIGQLWYVVSESKYYKLISVDIPSKTSEWAVFASGGGSGDIYWNEGDNFQSSIG